MKTYLILCCILFGSSAIIKGQAIESNISGVYLTQQDFISNNIYHLAKNDDKNFVRVGSNESLVVYRESEKAKFKFREVFGYVDNGEQYRKFGEIKLFTKYGYAKILDARGFVLYSATYASHKVGRIHYFYSLSKDSPIKYFSKRNLKEDFASNTEFLQAIEKLRFRDYSMQTDGKYLINNLYLKTIDK